MTGRVGVVALLLVVFVGPLVLPESMVTILNYTGLFGLVAVGLALLTGIGGMTSFGQAAFVGVGAYATAYLTTQFAWSPWLTLWVSIALTGICALVLAGLTLRLAGHYLPISTIAWGLSLYFLAGNLGFLGGHTGISGVPVIEVFGIPLDSGRRFAYLVWAFMLMAVILSINLLSSREGRAIRCLKGGRIMGAAMGVDIGRSKLIVFLIAALLAAISGWLYAHLQRFVNPTPFGLNYGIEYLFMAVVGGVGHVWGALLGAGLITVMREWLVEYLPMLIGQSGNYEVIVLSVLIIILLQRAPDGIWPWLSSFAPDSSRVLDLDPSATASLEARPRPEANTVLLEVTEVTKKFGGLVAVEGVNLQVRAAEILALIGPNGAGKTTLFNLISGVAPMTSGEIRLRSKDASQLRPHEIARLGMSRTFQHVKLLPHMSVLENVAIGAHARGSAGVFRAALRLNRAEERRLLADAARQIRRVGLEPYMYSPAGSLPLGDQRIAEIARSLASNPSLLLLDEPAAGLRLKEKEALAALLRQLRDDGIGILLVEHDMDFVMGLVDRVVVMEFGQKIAQGLPLEIQQNAAVREAYLGSAA